MNVRFTKELDKTCYTVFMNFANSIFKYIDRIDKKEKIILFFLPFFFNRQNLQHKNKPKKQSELLQNKSSQNSFGVTLIELLIAVAIISVLLIVIFFIANRQIFKAKDGIRKADLNELSIILEDFYNNKGCYPRPTEICYNASDDTINPCYICGEEANPLPNYKLPCNPDHPNKRYLYEVEEGDCPQWYKLYTELAHTTDSGDCPYGICGPEGGYDYGLSSQNVNLSTTDRAYGWKKDTNVCASCRSATDPYSNCNLSDYYSIHGTQSLCCSENNYQPDNCSHHYYDDDFNCFFCEGTLLECNDQYPSYTYDFRNNYCP